MKLHIKRSDLVSALAIVKAAACVKGGLPILANVAIRAFEKSIELTCTDLDLLLKTKCPAEVRDNADPFTVPVITLYDIVHSLGGNDLTIEGNKKAVHVFCGESKYTLGILSIDEFPPTPKLKGVDSFDLGQATLRSLLHVTAFVACKDESRYVLQGCLFELDGKAKSGPTFTVSACDGRRLATVTADLDGNYPTADVIVPSKAVTELLRLLNTEDETVKASVTLADNAVMFQIGDTTLHSKLIEGTYPDYTKIIPRGGDSVPIGRADLLSALRRISIIADTCVLHFKNQTLTISSRADKKDSIGEAVESLLIPKTKELKAIFNVEYLSSALQAVDDDEVLFFAEKGSMPALLTVKSSTWRCVIAAMSDAGDKATEQKPAAPVPDRGTSRPAAAPAVAKAA